MVKMPIYKKRTWKGRRQMRVPSKKQLRNAIAQAMPPVRTLNGRGIGFPKKLKLRMTYGEAFTFGSISGSTPEYKVFRANSIYDPNFTDVGHQPRYFDQISALYKYYHVEASRISISCNCSSDQGGLVPFISTDSTTDSLSIPTSFSDCVEFPNIISRLSAAENSGPLPVTLTKYVRMKDFQEEDRTILTSMSTNPSNQLFFIVGAFNAGAANTGCWFTVRMVFDVVVSELIEPSES